ncbi:MAG TPA: acetophenone carboxylase [Deltaproteobacteria bacterium]|nr:acetophenone carboxylase [Deltaproteobacteria bacterium]
MERIRFTEYLDLDLEDECWYCHVCGYKIGSARDSYKKGCLLYERDPSEIHKPLLPDAPYDVCPNKKWVSIIEFYCPGCGTQIETEYLPPGHPITVDIEVDIDSIKKSLASGEVRIVDGKLRR